MALVEYGSDLAGDGLFERQGVAAAGARRSSRPHRMPRAIPGRSASQHFFTAEGRAFCLFTVLGSHSRRMATVPRAARSCARWRRVGHDDACAGGGRERMHDHRADLEPDVDAPTATDPGRASALAEAVERPIGPGAPGRPALAAPPDRRAAALLVGAAVAGSALATDPKAYALRPQTAYATICGPANTASSGWSIFCATVNKGAQRAARPAASRRAGGRRPTPRGAAVATATSSTATPSARSARAGAPTTSVTAKCWNCSCRSGSTATCDQRKAVLQRFPLRPVQHPGEVQRRGALPGRVVRAALHAGTTAPRPRSAATPPPSTARPTCRAWGPMEQLYTAMGGQRSYLKASTGPIRTVGDGRGRTSPTRAAGSGRRARPPPSAMTTLRRRPVRTPTAAPRTLGYPKAARVNGLRDGGWIHAVREGLPSSTAPPPDPRGVRAPLDAWVRAGRENGHLQYPLRRSSSAPTAVDPGLPERLHRRQLATSTARSCVWGAAPGPPGSQVGREADVLGLPERPRSDRVRRAVVAPASASSAVGLGALPAGRAWAVRGAVLDAWQAAGGAAAATASRPRTSSTTPTARQTGAFEGGTITV